MLDLRQTSRYAKYISSIGWIVERKGGVNYFIKKLPLIGSFIKIQRQEKIDFKNINKIAKKYRAIQLIIEPKYTSQSRLLTELKFRRDKASFIPSKTIHIDLVKSEKALLAEMHYKTRYNIKTSQKKGLKIKFSNDIKKFADFWQECAKKQRGVFLSQKKEIINIYKAFGPKAHIITTLTKENELISGILMVATNNIAYYMYAASNKTGKKLFAPTLNVWESIKLAKDVGCKVYDFEGIYDERFPLESWRGFTRFKKSFGGREVEYPGTYTKLRFPW